ncbi:MAG: hypothetical protein WCP28_14445, partial [Actinomycetes bacterium]
MALQAEASAVPTDWLSPDAIDPQWSRVLQPIASQFAAVDDFLAVQTSDGYSIAPSPELILAAFSRPLADVRVLLVGQDPYPTARHA